MNAGPGKFLLTLLFAMALFASDYSYKLHISKRSLCLKEPFVVIFDINQTDSSKVMFFDFTVKRNGNFFARRLKKSADEGYHARKEQYVYLLYPLKSGSLTLDFDLLVRRGNDDLLTTAFTGGRYNVKAVETEDRHEEIPPQKIEVKALPVKADIVGSFSLERRIKSERVEAFEPLYIEIEINGTGYAPDIVERGWIPKIDGVKIFSDKPKIDLKYTQKGIETKALFAFAIVSEKGYMVPAIHMQAFDPVKRKPYTIDEPEAKIDVVPIDTSSLIDRKTVPPPVESPVEAVKTFFIYLFVFAAGWVGALLALRLKKRFPAAGNDDREWREMVKSSKDARTLLKLLLLKDPKKFEPWIERLESAVYGSAEADLKEIVRGVLHEK